MKPWQVVFGLFAAGLYAQHSEQKITNPYTTPEDRLRGAAIFRSQCASCHGAGGTGGASGPSLAKGTFRRTSTDEGLFRIIGMGVPGTSMPGFDLKARESWQVVAYLRGLSGNQAKAVLAGDLQAGQQLFGARGCSGCHVVKGKGGLYGPDLSSIGEKLTAEELRQALADPSATVAPDYWQWEGTTVAGETLRGTRLNEDTFSVQIRQTTGKAEAQRLRTFDKSQLRSHKLLLRSPMPSFRDSLTAAEWNNLLAYLSSLQGSSLLGKEEKQ